MLDPVIPLLQVYVLPPVAFKVELAPKHIEEGVAVALIDGAEKLPPFKKTPLS